MWSLFISILARFNPLPAVIQITPDMIMGPRQPVGAIYYPQTGNIQVWKATATSIDARFFNGWFKKKRLLDLVAAMVMVESSGGINRVRRVSAKDTSFGPMHVTPYTAKDIYSRGYTAFQPTETALSGTTEGMYFGMAYVKILYEVYGKRTTEEIARSYNGGPGYSRLPKAVTQTAAHWQKVKSYIA